MNILEKMLPSSEKNNFKDFVVKFHLIDFFPKYNQNIEKKINETKFDKEIYEIIFFWTRQHFFRDFHYYLGFYSFLSDK